MADFVVSAFADEADTRLAGQISALKVNGITHIELRGLDGRNISDYNSAEARKVREILDFNGIGVSAIGSRFGKINIRDSFDEHFDDFKQCVENACILGTENIRIFSFYLDGNEPPEAFRDEVFCRLEKMADYSLKSGVYCCHENEKGIYGDTDGRCLDILKTFEGKIRGVFDPANFVQCGVPVLGAYEKLEKYIEYMHIKDCRSPDGFVVPCGMGDGHISELLKRFSEKSGRRFLTLEPHLKVFKGLEGLEKDGGTGSVREEFEFATNLDAFNAASRAFKKICEEALR